MAFVVYVFLTVFRFIDVDLHWDVFMRGFDERVFWTFSQEGCGKSLSYLIRTELLESTLYQDESGNVAVLNERAYLFYIKTLAMLASRFFDGNHVLYQLLGTSILGTYISIFMIGMINKVSGNLLYNKTMAFMCLTCLLPVSLIIHRDVMLMLLYVIAMYLSFCRKLSIKVILIQILLGVIAYYVRPQNGFFMGMLIGANILSHIVKEYPKWVKVLLIIIGVIVVIAVLPYLNFVLELNKATQEVYGEYGKAIATNGLSSFADRLPGPLRTCALVFQGQFHPLPIWAYLTGANTLYGIFRGFLWMIVSVYWFRVFSLGAFFVIFNHKKYDKKVLYFWLVFLIYIYLSAVNADPRRLMAMYVAPYLLFLCSKDIVDKNIIRKFDKYYYSFVSIFMIVVFILKGGF